MSAAARSVNPPTTSRLPAGDGDGTALLGTGGEDGRGLGALPPTTTRPRISGWY